MARPGWQSDFRGQERAGAASAGDKPAAVKVVDPQWLSRSTGKSR